MVGGREGQNTSVVNGVDFLPTIAAITGGTVPTNHPLDGEDMSKAWLGGNDARSRPLFWEWRYRVYNHPINRPPMIAVRDGNYKLLVNPDGSRTELYDLSKDPSKTDNVADEHPDMAKKLSEQAIAWFGQLPKSPWDDDSAGKTTGRGRSEATNRERFNNKSVGSDLPALFCSWPPHAQPAEKSSRRKSFMPI